MSRLRSHLLGVTAVATLLLGGLAVPSPVAAGPAAGSLDPGFGSGGIRLDNFGATEVARGVAV